MSKINTVNVTAQQVYRQKLFVKVVKVAFLILMIIMSVIYLFLYIVYDGGRFTITLDKNMANRKNIYLSEDGKLNTKVRKLSADTIDYMDNISIKWLPDNLDTEADGGHNGDNYIAYSFYVVNAGEEVVNYWYEMNIDDTIKNVDNAIRIMIYKNGTPTIYAKENETTKQAESDTKKFVSKSIAVLEQSKKLAPKQKDHYTIVVWIEGDDPDCNNDLLGGEIKMHMDITEEHTDSKKS